MMSTENVRCSVIIPVLNGEAWIGEQLEALAQQSTPRSWEVLVADNGSTDGSMRIVEARARTFPVPLRIVDATARRGIAFARNAAVAQARGDHLIFCDCDDVVAATWVEAASAGLDAADAVCGPRIALGAANDDEARIWPPRASFGVLVFGNNYGMRRATFEALGGHNEELPAYGAEDVDLSIQLSDRSLRLIVVPEMVVKFRSTDSVLALVRKIYWAGISEVDIWRGYPERFGSLLGLSRALRSFGSTPVAMVRSRSLRSAVRIAVTRYAHVVAQLRQRAPQGGTPSAPANVRAVEVHDEPHE